MKLQDLKDMNKEDFLGLLGLETRHSRATRLMGALGALGVGMLVGAGLALLWAPKAGREMRQDLCNKLHCGCQDTGAKKCSDETKAATT